MLDTGQSDIEQRLERLERDQIAVFAVREAMRAAPLLGAAGPEGIEQLSTPSFRAILTACVAAFAPEARPAAESAANAAFAAATRTKVVYPAAYAAARAGTAAVASHAAAAAYAAYGAAYCSARAAAYPAPILAEAWHDLARLEGGLSGEALRASPLWPNGAPPEFDAAVARLAEEMRERMARVPVWVDWYATRIGGWPELHPFERAWASLSEESWRTEPTALDLLLEEIRERGAEIRPNAN